jgi:N-methylhydantoinase A/oxoprolinase/acetone carboxylase beta subunit
MSPLCLGIDTGGTFTDGVILDSDSRSVIRKTKALTTHSDLRICIKQVLDRLLETAAFTQDIHLVSLSTTLATNAIVEGKSRPVGLFLIGYDPELVHKYHFQRQFGVGPYFFIDGGMDLHGREQSALDEQTLKQQVLAIRDQVEALAVSSYGGTLNAAHEQRAGEIIHLITGLPVVQGHHLTSRLNSIRRATTASLNASLLSTAYDFLNTMQAMMVERGIHCPLVVVRGDGSLVSAEFAAHRPVEIIHSGPATSAIGGLYLSQADSALVVDIGGTTTDLALLQNGRTLLDGSLATVGGYHTSVRTIRARSFGLGGDSIIRFTPRFDVTVGPERVVPLSYLASQYAEVKRDLSAWLRAAPAKFYSEKLEFWMLRRGVKPGSRQDFSDPRTLKALELMQDGPKRLSWLLKQVGAVSAVQIDGPRLVREDIIMRAGLTPTDLLHVTGEYAPWDCEIAQQVLEVVAGMWGIDVDEAIQRIRMLMTRKIVAEILQFVTGKAVEKEVEGGDTLGKWAFDHNLTPADPFLEAKFQLRVPLIGIGAPARAFLTPVADALGTSVTYPEHYEVANAVGTVVSRVLVQKDAEVMPMVEGTLISGYLARADGYQKQFSTLEEAIYYARDMVGKQALDEAHQAGARDAQIEVFERDLLGGMVHITAQAVGKPG